MLCVLFNPIQKQESASLEIMKTIAILVILDIAFPSKGKHDDNHIVETRQRGISSHNGHKQIKAMGFIIIIKCVTVCSHDVVTWDVDRDFLTVYC